MNKIQRAVLGALGQVNATVESTPKPGQQVMTPPASFTPGFTPPPSAMKPWQPQTPPSQSSGGRLQPWPRQPPPGELQRHPPRGYTPPGDLIVTSPYPQTVTGPTNPPMSPCGPSPCCRQYDWQWWNTAKI